LLAFGSTRVRFDYAGDCGALLYVDSTQYGSILTARSETSNKYQSMSPIAHVPALDSGSHTVELKVGCNGTGFYIGAGDSALIIEVTAEP
jgi:hypothetical protein